MKNNIIIESDDDTEKEIKKLLEIKTELKKAGLYTDAEHVMAQIFKLKQNSTNVKWLINKEGVC